MINDYVGFTRLTKDDLVNDDKTLLYGVLLEITTDGASVILYEGNDASSGRLLFTVKGLANDTKFIWFDKPLLLERGLYVDIGSNVSAVTLFWKAI